MATKCGQTPGGPGMGAARSWATGQDHRRALEGMEAHGLALEGGEQRGGPEALSSVDNGTPMAAGVVGATLFRRALQHRGARGRGDTP